MTVKLKGKVKDAQHSKQGLYSLGLNEVNGKSHWLQDSGTNAIWYHNGDWNIGIQERIGGSKQIALCTNEDVAGPQEATTWKYISDDKWITSDDILVDTFKPGMYVHQ